MIKRLKIYKTKPKLIFYGEKNYINIYVYVHSQTLQSSTIYHLLKCIYEDKDWSFRQEVYYRPDIAHTNIYHVKILNILKMYKI